MARRLTVSLRHKLQAVIDATGDARWVRRHRQVPLWRQARDLFALKVRGVGAGTYYTHGLFDRQRFPDLDTMLTYRDPTIASREFAHFTLPCLHGLGTRKHLLYRLLPAFGLPVPQIRAIYSPAPDGFERHRALTSPAQLAHYLETTSEMPLFGKPSCWKRGQGARILSERVGPGQLLVPGGRRVSVSSVVDEIHAVATRRGTYLLTELLRPDEASRALCGDTLATLRVVVLVRRGEPEILSAAILLPRQGQQVSNWDGAKRKPLCAAVDPETGRVSGVLSSLGPDRTYTPVHPDTGARVEGHTIAGWDDVQTSVFDAARAMSPFRMQHWDVALTSRGPVFLELELLASELPIQMHGPPGVYREQYLSFARTHKVW